jgi:hypothetical protein
MGTTPNRQLPYPELSDQANVPADMQELAMALDTALYDTGWIDGGAGGSILVANATNFTLTISRIRVVGKVCEVYIGGTMKVSPAITSTTGDIGNTPLGTLVAAYRPVGAPSLPLGTADTGRMVAANVNSAGVVSLSSTGGSVVLAIGEAVTVAGTYLL